MASDIDFSDIEFFIFVEDGGEPQGFPDFNSTFNATSALMKERQSFDCISSLTIKYSVSVLERDCVVGGEVRASDNWRLDGLLLRNGGEEMLKQLLEMRCSFHWFSGLDVLTPRKHIAPFNAFLTAKGLDAQMLVDERGNSTTTFSKWPQRMPAGTN